MSLPVETKIEVARVYEELLNIFQQVGEELKDDIDKKFVEFR